MLDVQKERARPNSVRNSSKEPAKARENGDQKMTTRQRNETNNTKMKATKPRLPTIIAKYLADIDIARGLEQKRYPIFHLRKKEEDFLALLCLVVVMGSQQWLGGPCNHCIPIVHDRRGHLVEMCKNLASARTIDRAGSEQQDRRPQAAQVRGIDLQPQQLAEPAQTLLVLSRRNNDSDQ